LLDIRKLPSQNESGATIYFQQKDIHDHRNYNLHNCALHIMKIKKRLTTLR